jgi:hypothetical protein
MADMTTPFEELLLAAAAPAAPAPVTPPRPEREPPVCPDAPVRLPLSEDEEDEEDEEEDDGEEVPPPVDEEGDEEEEADEADPDNTYIPVHLFSKSPDMAELLAVARVLLEVDYRINGKVLLAAFLVLVAFLILAVRR